jgi:hypothetical protein
MNLVKVSFKIKKIDLLINEVKKWRQKGNVRGEMVRKDLRGEGKISSRVGRVVDELH